MSEDRNILNSIRTICANRESGRLEILAGSIQGELSFADGKLVDARFGHLTGFRAVNAVVAMRDARFSFDSAFAPLGSSSITSSERVVLKQFFGIDAAATSEYLEPVAADWPLEEAAPVVAVADAPEEVTIVSSHVKSDEVPIPLPLPPVPLSSYHPAASRFSHRTGLAFAVLAIAMLAAAVVLIYRFRNAGPPMVAASVESSARPASAEAQAHQPESRVAQSNTIKSVSAPAVVKEGKKPLAVTEGKKSLNPVQDLSGKWTVVNSVDTTAYRTFKNMKIGFDLAINQTGSTFTGNGYKVSENGRHLAANSRTPIQVKGSINGDRIEATFIEEGTARKSNGKFVWRIDKAGRGLTGNFATDAARSKGKSAATRL